ncbi:unnamed protein product [Calypogeia fissa]
MLQPKNPDHTPSYGSSTLQSEAETGPKLTSPVVMRDSLEYLKGGSTNQFQLGGANYHSTGSLANPQGKTRDPSHAQSIAASQTCQLGLHYTLPPMLKPPLRRTERRHRRALKPGTTQLREKDRERRARVAEAAASAKMRHTVPLAYSAGGGGRGAAPS